MGLIGIRSVCDHRVYGESRAEARGVLLKDNMDRWSDAASLGVVDLLPWGVMRVADHDTTKRFFAEFPTELVGYLVKTMHPNTRNLEAFGADDVRRVRETPPVRPAERL
jgi:hypothetical protein